MIGDRLDEVLTSGHEVYLSNAEALECVDTADRRGIAIIGLEVFHRTTAGLVANADGICDWTGAKGDEWNQFRQQVNALSRRFLRALPDQDTVAITLVPLSQEEWENRRPRSSLPNEDGGRGHRT